MLRSIIIVVALLAALTYAAMFLNWNRDTTANIITLNVGTSQFWLPDIPIGLLPMAGALIGAIAMALAAWSPWASQRAAAKSANAKVEKALAKVNECKDRITADRREIEALRRKCQQIVPGANQLAPAPDPNQGGEQEAQAEEPEPQRDEANEEEG